MSSLYLGRSSADATLPSPSPNDYRRGHLRARMHKEGFASNANVAGERPRRHLRSALRSERSAPRAVRPRRARRLRRRVDRKAARAPARNASCRYGSVLTPRATEGGPCEGGASPQLPHIDACSAGASQRSDSAGCAPPEGPDAVSAGSRDIAGWRLPRARRIPAGSVGGARKARSRAAMPLGFEAPDAPIPTAAAGSTGELRSQVSARFRVGTG